jgi:flagellar basal body-associated protein FliL
MSEERERLNQAFNRSRSRLAYVNIGLAVVLVLAAIIQICIMLLSD